MQTAHSWEHAVSTSLKHLLEHAARPAQGEPPASAEAVLFADRSEMLACLASDWCVGKLYLRWWWQSMFREQDLPGSLIRAWLDQPPYIPAALQHLARRNQAASFVRLLPQTVVSALLEGMLHSFALHALRSQSVPERSHESTSLQWTNESSIDDRSRSIPSWSPLGTSWNSLLYADGEVRNEAPWKEWVLECERLSQGYPYDAEQHLLLGIGLMLVRAPTIVRSASFAHAVHQWRQEDLRTQATTGLEQRSHDSPGNTQMSEIRNQAQNSSIESHKERDNADTPFKIARGETVGVQLRQDEENDPSHFSTYNPSLSPHVERSASDWDDTGHGESPTVLIRVDVSQPTADLSARVLPQVDTSTPIKEGDRMMLNSTIGVPLGDLLPPALMEDAPTVDATRPSVAITGASPIGANVTSDGSVWEHMATVKDRPFSGPIGAGSGFINQLGGDPSQSSCSLETQFGGLFYLINVGVYLELYADFTTPAQPGIPLTIWDFIALLGYRLLGASIQDDPVWELLTLLAGRNEQVSPGAYFEPATEWRMPVLWLASFSGENNWRWEATHGRLRVHHPAGFLILDVPMEGDNKEQLEREMQAYRDHLTVTLTRREENTPFSLTIPVASSNPPGVSSQVVRWLDWLAPYLYARLQHALGTTDDPVPTLCMHHARIDVTATHLDVYFSLAALPIEVRIAGLDRNPGWVPAAGRYVTFYFE